MSNIKFTMSHPHFFPPLYLLNRYLLTDYVVVQSDIDFKSGQWMSDTRLDDKGTEKKLILPLKRRTQSELSKIKINTSIQWVNRTIRNLREIYSGYPGYEKEHVEVFELVRLVATSKISCADVNIATMKHAIAKAGGVGTKVLRVEALDTRDSDLSVWITNTGEKLKANEYVCGRASIDADLNIPWFKRKEITLSEQMWVMHPYRSEGVTQQSPVMSYLDPLLKGGAEFLQSIVTPKVGDSSDFYINRKQ